MHDGAHRAHRTLRRDGGGRRDHGVHRRHFRATAAASRTRNGALTLDEERGGGWPLDLGLRLADGLLRVQAFALPYREDLDFGQFLHWNRQTRMARFACTRAGDIWVQADLPAELVSAELLDRLLGLVVEGALNVRAYAARRRSR